MRWVPSLLAALACLGLLAPHVSALPVPRAYFFEDTEDGPLADGLLRYFDPKNPVYPNATSVGTRLVFPAVSGAVPVQFLTDFNETQPNRLRGPVYLTYYPGASTVANGNMTISLIEVPQGYDPLDLPVDLPIGLPISDPILPPPLGPEPPRLLASASLALDANVSNAPEPTALVPPQLPDPQGDPVAYAQAYAGYVAAYELFQLMPALGLSPRLVLLGILDVEVNATSRMAVQFTLTQGSSQAPLPMGAFGQFQYDGLLAPAFVYIPWDDPTKTSTKPTKTSTVTKKPTSTVAVPSSKPPTGGVTTINDGAKPTPDAGLLLLPALGALALMMRRRLPK